MTPEQEAHLESILYQAQIKIELKYRKGQAEHGGNLADMNKYILLENAIEEAVDQLVYLLTLREVIKK